METTLTRYRRCCLCAEAPAVADTDLCRRCRRDLDRAEIDDNPVDNYEPCPWCGGELSRNGHCFSVSCAPECHYGPADLERAS